MTNGYRPFINSLIVLVLSFTISASSIPSDSLVDLEQALKDRQVEVEISALGGHSGECISMQIENNSTNSLTVHIPAGLRLASANPKEQDILIVKESTVRLAPSETWKSTLVGYCCQSSNSSPASGSKFTVLGMAIAPLAKLAKFINEHRFHRSDIQSAVWSISNGYSVGSLRKDDARSRALAAYVAEIKGVELPWYDVSMVEGEDSLAAFSALYSTLIGTMEYEMQEEDYISLLVLNENGHTVKIVERGLPNEVGAHSYEVEMDLSDLPKGNYALAVRTDENKEIEQKAFQL